MSTFRRLPPPMLFTALLAGAMYLLARSFPELQEELPMRTGVALLFGIAGLLIAAEGVRVFRRARTTVNPLSFDHVSSLVTTGIYAYSRNPMYLGMMLILIGWGWFLSHPGAAAMLPLFVWWMNVLQIGPEERYLESVYGDEFREYRQNVRRWI